MNEKGPKPTELVKITPENVSSELDKNSKYQIVRLDYVFGNVQQDVAMFVEGIQRYPQLVAQHPDKKSFSLTVLDFSKIHGVNTYTIESRIRRVFTTLLTGRGNQETVKESTGQSNNMSPAVIVVPFPDSSGRTLQRVIETYTDFHLPVGKGIVFFSSVEEAKSFIEDKVRELYAEEEKAHAAKVQPDEPNQNQVQ